MSTTRPTPSAAIAPPIEQPSVSWIAEHIPKMLEPIVAARLQRATMALHLDAAERVVDGQLEGRLNRLIAEGKANQERSVSDRAVAGAIAALASFKAPAAKEKQRTRNESDNVLDFACPHLDAVSAALSDNHESHYALLTALKAAHIAAPPEQKTQLHALVREHHSLWDNLHYRWSRALDGAGKLLVSDTSPVDAQTLRMLGHDVPDAR